MAVAFTARFVDELLSGAWTVLTPTFRRVFGLNLFQVGLLVQVLEWVALVVEPLAASMIDHSSRRRLLAGGAAVLVLSTVAMAAAPGFAVLLLGFALYGVGSGPLAHTADVVVLESFPHDPERAYSRATVLETCGALLVLDRWLAGRAPRRILQVAAAVLVVLPAAWVAAPGVGGRVVLAIPLAFTTALVWPLAKTRSLTIAPELAGASQAVTTLYPIIPLTLAETWFASTVGIGPAMAVTAALGAGLMLLLTLGDGT